jgi:3',5'-cyclic AMP phosphodiesterase CpdA
LERCLSWFTHPGPKLFVPGNHELWTVPGGDSHALLADELPRRVRALGWRWLPGEPFVENGAAIVGSLGWYDYSFAPPHLGIPRRFYENKVSPGAAAQLAQHRALLERTDDIALDAMEIVARWNDAQFVHLGRSDEQFLDEQLAMLRGDLQSVATATTVLAAIHHLPFPELLPPNHSANFDFAKAFLGSGRIGELLLEFPPVKHVYCGHSHFAAEAQIGRIRAISTGSGYRHKTIHVLDLV